MIFLKTTMKLDKYITKDNYTKIIEKYFTMTKKLQKIPNPFTFLTFLDATEEEMQHWVVLKNQAGIISKWREPEYLKAKNRIRGAMLDEATKLGRKGGNVMMSIYEKAFQSDTFKEKEEAKSKASSNGENILTTIDISAFNSKEPKEILELKS